MTSATNYAMISGEQASNTLITNIDIKDSFFGTNRAISFRECTNMTVNYLSISDSYVGNNFLMYFSQTKDLTLENIDLLNIGKTQSGNLLSLILLFCRCYASIEIHFSDTMDRKWQKVKKYHKQLKTRELTIASLQLRKRHRLRK